MIANAISAIKVDFNPALTLVDRFYI